MIPVIFIHIGYQNYLEYTVKKSLEKNNVIYISDTNLPFKNPNLKFEKIEDFSDGFDEFGKNYVHLNTTPFSYELFCYKRWFVLKNYMLKNNIDVVFYVDSDVLLFTNVTDEWEKFKNYDFTLLHRSAATSSFITLRGIKNFCDFLVKSYSDKNSYQFRKMESHFRVRQSCNLPGGVCDMTALEIFHYNDDDGGGPGRVGEMMQIISNSTYDHNINTPDNDYEYENNIKKIEIIEKKPFVFNKKLNKKIEFKCLHFQGNSKNLIKNIYERTH
jgi:hypothetical protein